MIVSHRGSSAVALNSASGPFVGIMQSKTHQNNGRLPSDVYEADAELSETGPEITPSMGSRTIFEHGLADRSRRYLAVTGHDPGLDDTTPTEPQLSKSPTIIQSSLMPLKRLTDDDIMNLGTGDIEDQNLRQMTSNSDTDVSLSSPWKHAALLTQEDAYEAGMRAAGIVCPAYSRPASSTRSELEGFDLPNSEVKPHISTPTGHWRTGSDLSDDTSDSCAVTTSSPSCNLPPPLLILHVRSQPARQSTGPDVAVLNATDRVEIPIAGPANTGLHPSLPAMATSGGKVATDTPRSDSSLHGVFNAAMLPSFGKRSIHSVPKSKRALRRQRRANRKVAMTKTIENDTRKSASPGEIAPQPLISIKHFELTDGDPQPYAGHELDAIQNIPQRRVACFPQKVVSFAERKEIIGASDAFERLSPRSSPQ